MIHLAGYRIIEQIFKGYNSTIYRGIRNSDECSVIIKAMNNEYPGLEELARFRREYQILSKLTGNEIIKVYDIIYNKNGLAIILEDIKGKSISDHMKVHNLSLAEKLTLAISLSEAIQQIHNQNIIHKDINPSNIVWNIDNNQLRVIDFGISTELSKEKLHNSSILEGTVPYASPEQTGKFNRVVDYRSDFYSLGITFFEIFTGLLPFTGDDLKLTFSHMTNNTKGPDVVNKEVTSVISDIIMKLLNKNTDDRYQSIQGLKYDLLYCRDNLEHRDKLFGFKIAQKDFSDRFQIPQKLYGRENKIEKILKTFEDSLNEKTSLLLISGYSGIGKTSIVKEIYKSLIDKCLFFVSGKFNQLEQNSPYIAIISAFRDLIEHLVLDHKNIETWKSRLSDALGTNGKIMLDLIPELKMIIGDQPEIPSLNPIEEKNRFQIVFNDFIKVFAKKEHPLVIFLDDLQWSDFSTIEFLKCILTSSDVNNLLIVGTYRDNEVRYGHPLMNMLDDVTNHHGNLNFLNQIVLEPLNINVVNQMVSDTLKRKANDTFHLSSLIYRKTKGNPFFVTQLLTSIHQKGGFKFNENTLQWDWDLEKIEKFQISANVADFLIESLNELPENALELIRNASCMGDYFDLKTLYSISNEPANISDALWLIIKKDLILPVNHNYQLLHIPEGEFLSSDIDIQFRFSHDRIQQSAYSLISDNEKMLTHKKIGKILFDTYTSRNSFENNIFEVVNHLNIGRDVIDNNDERIELAEMNYQAGLKAKTNSAYDIANNHLSICKSLRSANEWKECPDKLFRLLYELTETIFLAGNLQDAFEQYDDLLEAAVTNIDKSRVFALKAKILDFRGDKREVVIDEIRKGLSFLGVFLPNNFDEIDQKLDENVKKLKTYLENSRVDDLINLPEMTDENKIMIMKLFFQVQAAAFQHYPPLNFLIQLKMFNMALSYGTTKVSCKNYTECGIILGSILGNYEMSYKLSKVAFKLLEKYRAKPFEAGCYYIFATFIAHWRTHYSESLAYYDLSIKRGMETGDMWHASFSTSNRVHLNFYTGMNLVNYRYETEKAIKFLEYTKVLLLIPTLEVFLHTINQLQLKYDFEKENSMLEKFVESKNMVLLCTFGGCNLIVNYLLGNNEAAEKWDLFTEPYLQGETGIYSIPDHYMFQSLLLAKKYEDANKREKEEIVEVITKNIQRLKVWSDNCPPNFSHKYFLVSAEFAKIKNEPLENILIYYKKALSSISSGEFVHMKAIINELIGEFWFCRDEELIGKVYIKEAHYFYKLWGAYAKVNMIENRYSEVFSDNIKIETKLFNSSQKTSTSKCATITDLDLEYILKASQAISCEIKIDKLLNVLMRIIVECTGAQHGCLILKHATSGNLHVEARKIINIDEIETLESTPIYKTTDLCLEIVQYVARTQENVVLSDAKSYNHFQNSNYIISRDIKSVLCIPVMHKNNFLGIIYLENNIMEKVFTLDRVNTLKIILSQITASIENARLHESLEDMVRERTALLEKTAESIRQLRSFN